MSKTKIGSTTVLAQDLTDGDVLSEGGIVRDVRLVHGNEDGIRSHVMVDLHFAASGKRETRALDFNQSVRVLTFDTDDPFEDIR